MAHSTITMRDIAEALGVSVATVSRALKDSPRISAEQRDRIKSYAKAHDYYPNVLAECLRSNVARSSKAIGVIVPQFEHFYFSSVLSGINQEAMSHGYTLMVSESLDEYETEALICKRFLENRVCGVIVSEAKNTVRYDHFKRILDCHMPLVFYDRICTGINCDRVVVDDYQGAFNAVNYMIERGCRRVAFYGSPMTMEISKNRYNGYRDALLHNGLEPDDRRVHQRAARRGQRPNADNGGAARPKGRRGGCQHPHKQGGRRTAHGEDREAHSEDAPGHQGHNTMTIQIKSRIKTKYDEYGL